MALTNERPRNCYCKPGATHCGKCQVCGKAGHVCHFPGSLPYTGAWCDAHYAILYDRMEAAEDAGAPYGLRDFERLYFCSPGRRRWHFWRGESYVMEFRSQWLSRYVVIDSASKPIRRQERWRHPISAWLWPLELMRKTNWRVITGEEFERTWLELG